MDLDFLNDFRKGRLLKTKAQERAQGRPPAQEGRPTDQKAPLAGPMPSKPRKGPRVERNR